MFNKGDIVVARDGYLDKGETLKDTVGVVIDYNPDNDYLALGVLRSEKYAIAPTFSMRGCFYRHITGDEQREWGILSGEKPNFCITGDEQLDGGIA